MNDDDLYENIKDLYREMTLRQDVKNSYPSKSHEEKMRETNPALKDAWEQYNIILKLCLVDNPDPKKDSLADVMARKRKTLADMKSAFSRRYPE